MKAIIEAKNETKRIIRISLKEGETRRVWTAAAEPVRDFAIENMTIKLRIIIELLIIPFKKRKERDFRFVISEARKVD